MMSLKILIIGVTYHDNPTRIAIKTVLPKGFDADKITLITNEMYGSKETYRIFNVIDDSFNYVNDRDGYLKYKANHTHDVPIPIYECVDEKNLIFKAV